MRKKLRSTGLAIVFAVLAGCTSQRSPLPAPSAPEAAPAPTPAPEPTPPTVDSSPVKDPAPEPEPFPLVYTPEQLAQALLSDQQTFKRGADPKPYFQDLEVRKSPDSPPADLNGTLKQIADHLQAGEKPDGAGGPSATFIATLAGEIQVYDLGKEFPTNPETDHLLFTLRHGDEGWVPTRICQYRSNRVGVYRLKSGEPLLFCDMITGLGRPHRYVSIYRGSTEILRLDRLEAKPGGFELLPAEQDGPPPVRVIHYNDWFGRGRTSDWIMERVTLTWDGSKYIASGKEWLDDWAYHFARFDRSVGDGDLKRAAAELAFSPEGGLQAYLVAQAPGMAKNSQNWAWPRWHQDTRRFYVMGLTEAGGDPKKAPWYWLDFTPEGRIAGIGKQFTLPPE